MQRINSPIDALEQAAANAAGNWKKFEHAAAMQPSCVDAPEEWAVVHTHDSEESMGEVHVAIHAFLKPFTERPDLSVAFSTQYKEPGKYSHGFAIRVYKDGEITKAFKAWYNLRGRFDAYPILDEDGFSRDGFMTAVFHIMNNLMHHVRLTPIGDRRQFGTWTTEGMGMPANWAIDVWRWLWVNNPRALKSFENAKWANVQETLTLEHALFALIDLGLLADDDECILRDVAIENYRLQTWDVHAKFSSGQDKIACKLTKYAKRGDLEGGEVIFQGVYYGNAPGDSIDGDACLRGVLGTLTMQPGDTDDEYFRDYTPRQLAFAENEAEDLDYWAMTPQEDDEEPPSVLEDWIKETNESEVHAVPGLQEAVQTKGER